MATIALAIIAKDEVEQLQRLIKDYSPYFNEIAIAYDDDIIAEKIVPNEKVKLHKYEWCNNFAHKRNFLASKITSEFYLRCDTDDVIENIESLPKALNAYVRNGFTVVMFDYLYGFDASGVCNAKHWRETVIKNDGNIFWNKAIHENINPVSPRKMVAGRETQIRIRHMQTAEGRDKSFARNFAMLTDEYEKCKKEGKKQDARTVGYIARSLLGKKEYAKAIPVFEEFISTSGWDDDKYFAWVQMGDCWVSLGDMEMGITCCVEAMLMKPDYPDAYFHLMSAYYEKRDYKKAIEWGELGFKKPTPDTMYVIDPSAYTWRPAAQIAMCYMNVGKFEKAIAMLQKAKDIAHNEKSVVDALTTFTQIYNDNEAVKNYLRLMNFTKSDLKSFRKLVDSIPATIANDERIIKVRTLIEPPKIWDKKSVVFYCGGAWEDWVDTSVIGGIGGSEEATVYLAREFVKLGYKVTVYNQCGELGGNYNGVEYISYHKFNPKDEFDVLIVWRQNLQENIKARRKYIWMHDVPMKDMIIDEDFDTIDGVIVLSEYHKSFLSNLKNQDKIFVSRNGLNIKDLEVTEERNPHRLIYASSYDRGLQHLLEMWGDIRKEVPDAELHIFYGWNTYKEMMEKGRRPREFYDRMCVLMQQDGVNEHGRIGQKKLAREYTKSGIWAYPCHFEEISCIGAMRGQATGAVPVTTDYAALQETVQFGTKVCMDVKGTDWEPYKKALIKALKTPEWQEEVRKGMIPWARKTYNWASVAQEWNDKLF